MNPPRNLNYYKEFAFSKFHIGLGCAFLVSFATGNPLALMVGAAAYALGWIYLPTSKFFTTAVEKKLNTAIRTDEDGKLTEFQMQRNRMIGRLKGEDANRYLELSRTCGEVAANNPDNRLIAGKLQELLWTYLKMLLMQQGIEEYLGGTDAAQIDRDIAALEEEIKAIPPEKTRLLDSKTGLKKTLLEHRKSVSDAADNLQVINSELTRLEHEIQLLRADAIANTNSDVLSARINASVESLQETKNIMQQMPNMSELGLDLPAGVATLGFEPASPLPPALPVEPQRSKQSNKARG